MSHTALRASDAPPAPHPALALMERETRVRAGSVPRALGGFAVEPGQHFLHGDEFLLHTVAGIGFHYRRGEGIAVEAPAGTDPRDVALWLAGSVHAAVAALNGLYPLHASAIAHRGRVHAFTGAAGAGKSTLVAALGQQGFTQFADDTLLLDLSGDGAPLCLPGHKRLKLWPEALALAGVEGRGEVADDYPKQFVDPPVESGRGIRAGPLPLSELIFLEAGEGPRISALSGGEQIARLQDDHYTAQLWLAAARPDRAARFAGLARLAGRIALRRFVRPFDPTRFGTGVSAMAAHIRKETQA